MKIFNKRKQKIGIIIGKFLSIFLKKKEVPTEQIKKILIFDFHLIGDIVLLTALLKSIRQKYPESHITLVSGTWSEPILRNQSGIINEIVHFNAPWATYKYNFQIIALVLKLITRLRKYNFDLGIEVRGDLRQILLMALCKVKKTVGYNFSGGGSLLTDIVPDNGELKHLLEYHKQITAYLNCSTDNFQPEIWLSDHEKKTIKEKRTQNKKKVIGIHPGASQELRRFPDRTLIDLLNRLDGSFWEIRLFAGPNEEEYIKKITKHLSNQVKVVAVPLRQFVLELAVCDLVLCMDSSCGHIAAGLKIPTIVVFSTQKSEFTRPIGENINVLSTPDEEVPCRPCDHIKCIHEKYHYCMNAITVEQLISTIDSLKS